METYVRETGELTRVLEVAAAAADLESDVKLALRKRQLATHMKGFRPGRVPLHLIRRIHGEEVGAGVADEFVREVFQDLILESGKYDVIGQPTVIRLDYDLDGDMEAHIEFEIRPEVILQDLSDKVLEVPVIEVVTDEDIQRRISGLRESEAKLRPLSDEEVIGEEGIGAQDRVKLDAVAVDPETRVVLVGKSRSEVTLDFDAKESEGDPEYVALRAALTGRCVGDEVFVSFEPPLDAEALVETRLGREAYKATIKEAKRWELPEIDDEWVERVTGGRAKTVAELPEGLRKFMEDRLPRKNEGLKHEAVRSRMVELHRFPVPEGTVRREMARPQYGNEVEEADLEKVAARRRVERKLRWHFIVKAIEAREGIVVTDKEIEEDLQYRQNRGGRNTAITIDRLRQVNLLEDHREVVLELKIVTYLVSQFGEVRTRELDRLSARI